MEGSNSSTRAALAPVSGGPQQSEQQHGKGGRRLSVGAGVLESSSNSTKAISSLISPSKKRRSQSMGGALSETAAIVKAASLTTMSELSPRSEQ